MLELPQSTKQRITIKVVGIGGGGGNAVKYMMEQRLDDVEFILADTDASSLQSSNADAVLRLGEDGGANGDLEIGRRAALDDVEDITKALNGADMLIVVASMGGGTGTGAAPVIGEIARKLGILTIALVTKPFQFEGRKRADVAKEGIGKLEKHADSVITTSNNDVLQTLGEAVSLLDAFQASNNILLDVVQCLTDLISRPGMINVDFSDIRSVMAKMGRAAIGTGCASGEFRARTATCEAAYSPLLGGETTLKVASGVLVNITAGMDLSLAEFADVADAINEVVLKNATVVVGTAIDPEMNDAMRVTIIATGLNDSHSATVDGSNGNVTLIAPENTPDGELAELIAHLSNVYRSVGGDELVVTAVDDIPPKSHSRWQTPRLKTRNG